MSDALARLTAEAEIRRTLADYCQSCDDGRFDDFAQCFTADAEVHLGGRVVAGGRAEIAAWIAAGQPPERRGKHLVVNSLIELGADLRSATAASDFAFVARSDDGPRVTAAGRYADVLVPTGRRWLLDRREISLL